MHSPRVTPRHRDGDPRRTALHGIIAVVVLASLVSRAHAAAPDTLALRLPDDAVYQHTVGEDSAVVFRHSTHVPLASQRCTACHPRLFRILAPTTAITHAQMNAGQSCGACHDGEHAFSVKSAESCAACHVGRTPVASAAGSAPVARAGSAAFKGPKPIRYTQGEVSPGPVTFDHASHAKGGCTQCHPRLFAMKASSPKPRGDMHEVTACGSCHDGKHSFGVEDDKSCTRCHKEGAR